MHICFKFFHVYIIFLWKFHDNFKKFKIFLNVVLVNVKIQNKFYFHEIKKEKNYSFIQSNYLILIVFDLLIKNNV